MEKKNEMQQIMILIRQMLFSDIDAVAHIHIDAFPNDVEKYTQSQRWIHSKFLGWPVNRYFVAVNKERIIGYILWVEMGGFRKNCVLELEQLAIAIDCRGQSVGTHLLDESLMLMTQILAKEKRYIKLVEITTGKTNEAQRLYIKTLSASVKCKKKDFFEEDEVIMIARHSSINSARKVRGLSTLLSSEKVD